MGASKKNLDFTNVKEGGQFSKKHMPEGDYLGVVVKVEDEKVKSGDNQGQDQWLYTIKLKNTPSATYPYYCQLSDNMLWKVRNLLVAAGLQVPKKRIAVDPNKAVGKMIGVSLQDTEYNGRAQSEINAVFSASELEGVENESDVDIETEDEDEEYEAPVKAPAKAKKVKAAPAEEEAPKKAPKDKKAKKGKKTKVEADDEIDIEDLD